MIRERVAVGSAPTAVVAGWSSTAMFIENSSDVDVFIDADDETLDEPHGTDSAVRLAPGERLTVPHTPNGAPQLFAVAEGTAELTVFLPGWQ